MIIKINRALCYTKPGEENGEIQISLESKDRIGHEILCQGREEVFKEMLGKAFIIVLDECIRAMSTKEWRRIASKFAINAGLEAPENARGFARTGEPEPGKPPVSSGKIGA